MIDRESIYIPTDDEVLAVDRWERLNIRKKFFDTPLANAKDAATYVFYPETPGLPDFRFTSGYIRATFDRVERSMQAAIRDSGLDRTQWNQDWYNLMQGDVAPAPQLDASEYVCKEGHMMMDRKLYFACPCCSQVTWKKEL